LDDEELRRSAALEHRHWWYAGRRAVVRRELADLPPGRALDVGCGPGGNSETLQRLGWRVTALDYARSATEMARARHLPVVQADARMLPIGDGALDLVLSTDAWEHIEEDSRVAAEAYRVLRPGGQLLVMVPAGMDLWSGHDLALGHVRRYERDQLVALVRSAGFRVDSVGGWNVLLRPVARLRRRHRITSQSEMEPVNTIFNLALRGVVWLESLLPLRRRRGISLVLRATRP
jgi:SAM-dependent methyltransferase